MFAFLLVLVFLVAILLVTVVLLQAGQGGGLAALGGGTSTDSFLGGRQAVTILTKMSWWCGGLFLALCLVLAGLSSRGSRPRSVLEGRIQPPAPVAPLPLNLQPTTPATGTPATGAPAPTPNPASPSRPGGRN